MQSVWLGVAERQILISTTITMAPLETGGVLLGYRGEGNTIVIASIVGPGPEAIHSRRSFVPDHEYHLREIARVYEATGRHWTYIGDWHSHPGGSADLSKTDRRTVRRIATTAAARLPGPIMLVVAGGAPWRILAHQAIRTRWRIRIEPMPFQNPQADIT